VVGVWGGSIKSVVGIRSVSGYFPSRAASGA
jgi:hypothetical protein